MSGRAVDGARTRAACRGGFLLATELADALTRRGIPFREAHEIVGRVVLLAEDRGVDLPDLSLEELRGVSEAIDEAVAATLDLDAAIASRDHVGGTAPGRVREEIGRWRGELEA